MIRFVLAILVVGATGIATAAAAGWNPHPLTHRQQLNACMTKAMLASRTLSYNQANKLCKAQLQAAVATMAANRPTKP